MSAIAGIAYLKADGEQYDLRGNLNISIGGVERETVTGQDGVHGYTEMPKPSFMEAELSDSGGLSLEAIGRITDATITAELINGKVYVLQQAWCMATPELNTADGSMTVRFEAKRGQEITA